MSRNRPITYIAIIAAFIFFYSYLQFPSSSSPSPYNNGGQGSSAAGGGKGKSHVAAETIHGEVIMPTLGNETVKAELGRASWRLLHTMLARFPEKPTMDERDALKSYIHLFARLYPCGECASHFQLLLKKYPPQTSSRDAASQWGCVVHNKVNERLEKEIFDCGTIADKYHCGCADEDEKKNKKEGLDGTAEGEKSTKKQKVVDEEGEMNLVKEGLTRGG